MIDDVENRVGMPALRPILDRGQIGRGVEKRAVLLLTINGASGSSSKKHARRRLRFRGQSPARADLHDSGEPVVILAFAQRLVELHTQPLDRCVDVAPAGRQEFSHSGQVFRIADVKLGGFFQHSLADVGMLRRGGQSSPSFDDGQRRPQFVDFRPRFVQRALTGVATFRPSCRPAPRGFVTASAAFCCLSRVFKSATAPAVVVVDQPADEAIEPAQFGDRLLS